VVATDVVGREQELATVARLFEQRRAGPWVVVIEGDAGIGKTTLWEAALDLARDRSWRVLAARPAEAEARFSYIAVRDLLGPFIYETIHGLPGPQRRAVEPRSCAPKDVPTRTRCRLGCWGCCAPSRRLRRLWWNGCREAHGLPTAVKSYSAAAPAQVRHRRSSPALPSSTAAASAASPGPWHPPSRTGARTREIQSPPG